MRTQAKTRKEGIPILESFKIIFSRRNLGKEAAIEHINNQRRNKMQKAQFTVEIDYGKGKPECHAYTLKLKGTLRDKEDGEEILKDLGHILSTKDLSFAKNENKKEE